MTPVLEVCKAEPLAAAEMERSHIEDLHAARVVVCIMMGVFTAGLLLYTFICWQVM